MKDYHDSIVVSNSNYNAHFLLIKPTVLKCYVFACLVLLVLSITGIGQNPEYAEQVNAGSKSQFPYVIRGLIQATLSYWTFSILYASRHISSLLLSLFLNKILLFRVITSFAGALKYSAYLTSYATKLVSPLLDYLTLRYYAQFSWFSIKRSVLRIKLNTKILTFASLAIAIFIAGSYLFSLLNVDLLNVVVMKILIRADSYSLINLDSLASLSDEYSGNLFYFFHPFLKLIGLKAYNMPMGSFLIAQDSNSSVIGGPNVHLPVVLFLLGGRGLMGYAFIVAFGFLFSFLLCHSRNLILSYICFPNYHKTIYWAIFFFTLFPLLLQEPSAFGHNLFFAVLVYFLLRYFRPSLLCIFAPSSSNVK